jgi:hypothetical protein
MSNSFISLADLVKLNDQNARDLGITDLLNDAPVLKALAATTASNGTLHHYIKQTGAPTVGFRAINAGKDNGASGYTEVDVTLKLLDASFMVDKAMADNYRGGPEAFNQREALNSLKQAFYIFEKQIFYGTGLADASGFSGLADNTAFDGAGDSLVVNATGTTASTGSSAWLIRSTPDEMNATAVIGNSGEISIGETVVATKPDDSTATKTYGVYYTPIQAYCALQIGGAYSVVRIANLTADSGKGLTDAVIAKALALFPSQRGPTMLACNRRSLFQLQASRTATNQTGAPAPIPTESFGVPIIPTDSISSTETLLS